MTAFGKILITGASGYVGRALQKVYFSDQIIPLYKKSFIKGGFQFDALKDDLSKIINNSENISHCIILHARVQVDDCASDPSGTRELNMISVIKVIDWCLKHDVVPIFVSSEAVFGNDGLRPSDEDSVPKPFTLYGKMKLEVETYLRKASDNHCIIRLARVLGDSSRDRTGFDDWFKVFDKGGVIRCASDQIISPISISDAAQGLRLAAEKNLRGTFNLSGDGPITRLDFLKILMKEIQKKNAVNFTVEECKYSDFDVLEKRPLNSSMNNAKFIVATSFKPISYQEWCKLIV